MGDISDLTHTKQVWRKEEKEEGIGRMERGRKEWRERVRARGREGEREGRMQEGREEGEKEGGMERGKKVERTEGKNVSWDVENLEPCTCGEDGT